MNIYLFIVIVIISITLLLFICYFAHNPFLNLRMFNVFLDTHISVICVFTLFYRLLINII